MPLFPVRLTPANNQLGQSAQRLAGTFFNNSQDPTNGFVILQPLPLTLGPGASSTTDKMFLTGYNAFMVLMTVTTNNMAFKVNHLDPVGGVTILFTRTVATVAAGAGMVVVPFGFGNTAAAGGQEIYHLVSFTFTNTSGAGNSVLTVFPGLWGAVRG